jgi:hypothetical protein
MRNETLFSHYCLCEHPADRIIDDHLERYRPSGGLSIVPIMPWHRAPRRRSPAVTKFVFFDGMSC